MTGPAALEHVRRGEGLLASTAAALRVPAEEVPDRVEALLKEVRQLKKQLAAGAKSEGPSADKLLAEATEALRVTARGYHRVLRVARTLADLDGAAGVRRIHVAEALSYRRIAPGR